MKGGLLCEAPPERITDPTSFRGSRTIGSLAQWAVVSRIGERTWWRLEGVSVGETPCFETEVTYWSLDVTEIQKCPAGLVQQANWQQFLHSRAMNEVGEANADAHKTRNHLRGRMFC